MKLSELHVGDGPMICLLCFHAKWCLKHWAVEMGILAHASRPSGRRRQQCGVLGITPTKQHRQPASTCGLSPLGRRSFCGSAQVCLGPGGISSPVDYNRVSPEVRVLPWCLPSEEQLCLVLTDWQSRSTVNALAFTLKLVSHVIGRGYLDMAHSWRQSLRLVWPKSLVWL